MKKALFATTAIVSATMAVSAANAADKIKLGLGGYWEGYYHFVDQDADTGLRDHIMSQDSEVYFKGSTTLDNGVNVGVMIQLEGEDANGGTSDTIDDNYIYFDGGFGRIEFGQHDGASTSMLYVTPGVMHGLGIDTPELAHTTAGAGSVNTLNDIAGDANKIIYYTPRMSGFQLGVSYAPDTTQNKNGVNVSADAATHDVFDFGINYDGEFDGITVGGAFVYSTADSGVAGTADPEGWQVGANIGTGGFTFGATYRDDEITSTDATAWSIGASYESGPWGVAVLYGEREDDAANTETDQFNIEGTYSLGGGVSLDAGLVFADYDNGAGVADTDATEFVLGTKVRF